MIKSKTRSVRIKPEILNFHNNPDNFNRFGKSSETVGKSLADSNQIIFKKIKSHQHDKSNLQSLKRHSSLEPGKGKYSEERKSSSQGKK